jgi:hypothetical protein
MYPNHLFQSCLYLCGLLYNDLIHPKENRQPAITYMIHALSKAVSLIVPVNFGYLHVIVYFQRSS